MMHQRELRRCRPPTATAGDALGVDAPERLLSTALPRGTSTHSTSPVGRTSAGKQSRQKRHAQAQRLRERKV